MKTLNEVIIMFIIISWFIPFIINKFSKNKYFKIIPTIIPISGTIFSLYGIFNTTEIFNELSHYFGLSLSLTSLTTIAITIIILEKKNTKTN